MARRVVALLALLACARAVMISTTTATAALDDCAAMDIVELNMLRPRIAACQDSAVFRDATMRGASDALCDEATACGNLLPYLSYMAQRPCVERAPFAAFGSSLLEICDAYPYRAIDPKSILVGKSARSDL